MSKLNEYVIERIINNNVITSCDANGKQIVIMGKGIAFNRKVGQTIAEDSVEKEFILKTSETMKYLDVIEQLPAIYMDISIEILKYASHQLKINPSHLSYIMLADHIWSAVERIKKGIVIQNDMLHEIRTFYADEFNIAKKSLLLIKDETDVCLPEDEAGFIAFHLMNISDKKNSEDKTRIIKKIITIIEKHFSLKINKNTLYFERFITHLKYFTSRALYKETIFKEYEKDDFLYQIMKTQYKDVAKCVDNIAKYLKINYGVIVQDEEKGYLILHINNLLIKSQEVNKKS